MNYFCQDLCLKDPFCNEVSCAKVQQLFHIPVISPNIFYPMCPTISLCPMFHMRFLYLYAMSNVSRLSVDFQ